MRTRHLLPVLAAGLTIATTGCGADPYLDPAPTTDTVAGDPRQPPEERAGPRPEPDRHVADGAPTPESALRRYAELYTNWTADTLASRQRALARLAIDGARQTALLAAQRAARDDTLRRARVSNTGTVISIAAGIGSADGAWVVVTREKLLGRDSYRGLPATYHVTLAELEHLPAGWVVTGWMPQS